MHMTSVFFNFKLTKRKVPIVISVYAIIVISLMGICASGSNESKDIPFWVWPGYYVITVMLLTLLVRISEFIRDFLFNFPKIVKCPHCGAWNEYEELKCHSHSEHSGWRIVDRDIKDSYGNRVGSYESREQCTYSYYDYTLKCTKCGEEFEHTFSY